jgi:4-amino-4-deoxy-L-arabinose transferase-like glycosyltransferase
MRIGYMLYTNILLRGHDISNFDQKGHLDYIYQIFSTGRLPVSNESQFYHPPLQHILEAIVVKVYSWIRPGSEQIALFESAKIVPCFATCASLFVCQSICRALKLPRRAIALALAVVAFQPTFYLFSSSINNDALMIFFYLLAVLYTIRWYYEPSMKHILLLALTIGCGMMTKISVATVAFFTGLVFLAVLIRKWKERNVKPLLGQFAAFLGISMPLGLWYPVRNWVKFGQPLNYVLDINIPQLYCGDKSIWERFFTLPMNQLFDPLYCEPFGDYRLWLYTVKCSVFGEYSFDQHQWLAKLLIATNIILILLSLVAMLVIVFSGKKQSPMIRFGFLILWLIQIGFFILFNVQYPYGCTMDFRYIVPTAVIGAIYLGLLLERWKQNGNVYTKILSIVCSVFVALFCVVSVLFYTI